MFPFRTQITPSLDDEAYKRKSDFSKRSTLARESGWVTRGHWSRHPGRPSSSLGVGALLYVNYSEKFNEGKVNLNPNDPMGIGTQKNYRPKETVHLVRSLRSISRAHTTSIILYVTLLYLGKVKANSFELWFRLSSNDKVTE